jgi:hypothetical protein
VPGCEPRGIGSSSLVLWSLLMWVSLSGLAIALMLTVAALACLPVLAIRRLQKGAACAHPA